MKKTPSLESKVEKSGSKKYTFPRASLEQALRIPFAIKDKNGGNPWAPAEIAKAIGAAPKVNTFFYLTAASRDYGLTSGTRDTEVIALEALGRALVFAPDPATESKSKMQAFLSIGVFKAVLEYYKGSDLPEMKFLGNVLQSTFKLHPDTHEEFAKIFRENCAYLGITSGISTPASPGISGAEAATPVVTLAEASSKGGPVAFVIMPFVERSAEHASGFFLEVLRSLITPAAKAAGFTVRTANRQGSDVIQSTIVHDLLAADLVIADLTEHNPNVLFELGVRMAKEKPVVLVKTRGTGPLFDVDNMLRVFEYSANLWPTTIEKDTPLLTDFIRGAWENRDSTKSYMQILGATTD